MRKRLSATAILVALALVLVSALPAAATPAVVHGDGVIYVGTNGTCPDSGEGSVWGTNSSDRVSSDEAFYTMGMEVSGVDGRGLLTTGVMNLCGQLSRTSSSPEDGVLGTACNGSLYAPGGNRYYGHSGHGQLVSDGAIFGEQRVTQIRNVRWAPSATGSYVARGQYVDDPQNSGATSGTFIMQLSIQGGSCRNPAWDSVMTQVAQITFIPAPAVGGPAAGSGQGTMYLGSEGTCPDSGMGSVSGDSPVGSGHVYADEAFYQLGMSVGAIDGGGPSAGQLHLCGQLSTTPTSGSNAEDAAVGAACHGTGNPEAYYYGHGGRGWLDVTDQVRGTSRVVQIQNVAWAPSATGTLVARGAYAEDAGTADAATGTFVMKLTPLLWGMGCLGVWGFPATTDVQADITLIPDAA